MFGAEGADIVRIGWGLTIEPPWQPGLSAVRGKRIDRRAWMRRTISTAPGFPRSHTGVAGREKAVAVAAARSIARGRRKVDMHLRCQRQSLSARQIVGESSSARIPGNDACNPASTPARMVSGASSTCRIPVAGRRYLQLPSAEPGNSRHLDAPGVAVDRPQPDSNILNR